MCRIVLFGVVLLQSCLHKVPDDAYPMQPTVPVKIVGNHSPDENEEYYLRSIPLILPCTKGNFMYYTVSVENPYDDRKMALWLNHRALTFSFMRIFTLVEEGKWLPVCEDFGAGYESHRWEEFSRNDPFATIPLDSDAAVFGVIMEFSKFFRDRARYGKRLVVVDPGKTVEFQFLYYESLRPWCFRMPAFIYPSGKEPTLNYWFPNITEVEKIYISSEMVNGTKPDGSKEIRPGEINWDLSLDWPICNMTNCTLRILD